MPKDRTAVPPRKKKPAAPSAGTPDPRAPLDGAALLAAIQPLARQLEADLLDRARGSAAVLRGLRERWDHETAAHRTAEPFDLWQRAFVEQVAAAWILSGVFVRTLEDRGLLSQNRLAGPGAVDAQKAFFDFAPSLSERDYLLLTFRELSHLPAARDLFDARHNPVWMLGPSVDGARALLAFFRTPDADAPAFRFGGSDTRFLGDLYQDLSEDVRKRYALLQTPHFIESYILDHTLDRAIARFGLDATSLLDPTCGSGHFLLGAFHRLFDAFLRAEPGLDKRQAAQKALDRIAGADLNPYAVAIARFRLTLAFVEAGAYARLADAPRPELHLAVADSLLHGTTGAGQTTIADATAVTAEELWGHVYALEDPEAARDVLDRRYAAVVGNPPYITVKDAAVREEIRKRYPHSAFRSFSLAAPFAERFFQLAKAGGAVGMITANSFMKREFGRKLIEDVFPRINLDGIVNTAGAYIPGHGTPTVILFGTNESPQAPDVLAVLAKRGEPATPDNPEKGLVWRSVADHGWEFGFENDYVSVTRASRETLSKHPWSLGGGGAAELKELLEERAERRLGETAEIGTGAVTRDDDLFCVGKGALVRWRIPAEHCRVSVDGEHIRDWAIVGADAALWPYDPSTHAAVRNIQIEQALWPWRTQLADRVAFGKTQLERGLPWAAYSMYFSDRFKTPLTIAYAEVATHNHFVLDHGGKVFMRTAPIIKLAADVSEDDHLALLAYLNSSLVAFYLRQVAHSKGGQGVNEGHKSEVWEQFMAYNGARIADLPLPRSCDMCVGLARILVVLAGAERGSDTLRRMCAVQEDLDWHLYEHFGLLAQDDVALLREKQHLTPDAYGLEPGHRPFEQILLVTQPTTQWFVRNDYATSTDVRATYAPAILELLAARMAVTRRNPTIALLEQPEYKRRWTIPDLASTARHDALDGLLTGTENELQAEGRITPENLRSTPDVHDSGISGTELGEAIAQAAVPFLAPYRYTDSGMEKRAAWEHTWDLQRREDAGEKVGDIPVPPKYGQGDYREASYWRLRGKLDVPKERFISYPGCEGEDGQPLYGWAGWDHRQRAQALMTLYLERKQRAGWGKDRLLPMLAGLRELLPWLRQWHADVDPEYGESMATFYGRLYETERAGLGVTDVEVAGWRPAAKRSRKARV